MKSFATLFGMLLATSIACAPVEDRAPAAAAPPPPSSAPPATATSASAAPPNLAQLSALDRIRYDAKKVEPLVSTPLAKSFLAATKDLPHIAPRTLYRDADKTHFYSEAEWARLPADARANLVKAPADEELYYNTKYGSPLSYSRPLDLLASRGVSFGPKTRLLDFGYGYVGHLRLLASLGVDATGIDVDPLFRALYSYEGDQGVIGGKGSVRLLSGEFPKDPSIVAQVGNGYDVIISKNVLKRGYIHPYRPVTNPRWRIDLGVSDDEVLKAFHDALKPGGVFLIFNICPALTPPDKPFIPWSDGRSPWDKAQWEKAGFEVLEIDRDDLPAVQAMARALGWDTDPDDKMDIEHDLSALYTLVRRR